MNDEQKPYLSFLFISSRPTDVCVIYSVLCADIGIICSENEKNGPNKKKSHAHKHITWSRIKSLANCMFTFSKEWICKKR